MSSRRLDVFWQAVIESVDDPNEFVLLEAFRDGDAGAAHVQSDHFKAAMAELAPRTG